MEAEPPIGPVPDLDPGDVVVTATYNRPHGAFILRCDVRLRSGWRFGCEGYVVRKEDIDRFKGEDGLYAALALLTKRVINDGFKQGFFR